MRIPALLLPALSLAVFAMPVLSWEHVLNDYGNGQVMNAANSLDQAGTTGLTLGCLMGQGAFHLQMVVTGKPGVAQQPTELGFYVSGISFPVSALLGESRGHLIATASSETAPIADVARSIYSSTGPIEITLAGQTYVFDGGNFGDAFGAMLDSCG